MTYSYTRHIVNDMDASMVQRCIICGEVISDYTNAAWPIDDGPPKGFAAGEVFVSDLKNPTIYSTTASDEDIINNCK